MKPFKEVILFNWIFPGDIGLVVQPSTKYKLKQNIVHTLWSGSVEKFKFDFEIPYDAPLSTKETKKTNGDNAEFVTRWDWTTLNFKFNYQVWFKDSHGSNTTNYYVNGSNNTINITIPNVLLFDGNQTTNEAIKYYKDSAAATRFYNPNLFPIPITITSFVTSNKVSDFQNVTGSGNDSLCYLIFRYGVNGNDIEICLATKDNANFQVNGQSLIIPYASLTFTGFNKVKKLAGYE